MSKIMLVTIWHAGSNYVRQDLEKEPTNNVIFQHADEGVFKVIERAKPDEIVTTLKDPEEVAASWANRYDMLNDPKYRYYWLMLWAGWGRLIETYDVDIRRASHFGPDVVNSVGDPKGAKACLASDNMAFYKHFFPEDLVEFAEKLLDRNDLILGW